MCSFQLEQYIISQRKSSRYLLTAISLPHCQLWVLIKGQPYSPNFNHCGFVQLFSPKSHKEPDNKVGSLG